MSAESLSKAEKHKGMYREVIRMDDGHTSLSGTTSKTK